MQPTTNSTLEQRLKHGNKRIFIWTSAWVVTLALLAFGPKFIWSFNQLISIAVLIANLGCGYKMVIANKRLLDNMDELQRRIHMNAMAISLGVSMVFGAAYGLLEGIRLISFSPNASNVLFVMGISYMVAVFVGTRKYQ